MACIPGHTLKCPDPHSETRRIGTVDPKGSNCAKARAVGLSSNIMAKRCVPPTVIKKVLSHCCVNDMGVSLEEPLAVWATATGVLATPAAPTDKDWCPSFDGYHLYYPTRRQPSPAFSLVVKALRDDMARRISRSAGSPCCRINASSRVKVCLRSNAIASSTSRWSSNGCQ